MKALLRNFLMQLDSAFDAWWLQLTVGQSTYINIKSQAARNPALKVAVPAGQPAAPETIAISPESVAALCSSACS